MSGDRPEAIGISTQRIECAYALLEDATRTGDVPGAALLVARHGVPLSVRCFGRLRAGGNPPEIAPDTILLVASVTKPVTAAAAMLLVERGALLLDDTVCSIIPDFGNRGKDAVRIHHLMTPTSCLPDALSENERLREQRAPLTEFVRRIHDLELGFAPGTDVRYQSCGFAILGEVVERVSGASLHEFMRREIFDPLGMTDTSLGADGDKADRIAHVNVGGKPQVGDPRWNMPYWWNFRAPWGGMFSTVGDAFRFLQAFLNGGELDGTSVFSRATVDAMTTNQTARMERIPPETREGQAWGLGWRLHPAADWAYFGDLLSPGSVGHGGATGTVVWADPVRDLVCVLFTTQPSTTSERLLGRVSNLVAASAL